MEIGGVMTKDDVIYSGLWREKLEKRYGQNQNYRVPELYTFVTGTKTANWRADLVRWIHSVPLSGRETLIRRLRSIDQFRQAANELTFAGQFIDLGFSVEYEPSIDGLTPDWLMTSRHHVGSCLLEVISSNLDERTEAVDASKARLAARLKEIPVDAVVGIRLDRPDRALDDGDIKRIKVVASTWVSDLSRQPGDRLAIGRARISFISAGGGGTHVRVGRTGPTTWVSGHKLRNRCRKKAKKYTSLVESRAFSFCVGFISDFRTSEGIEELVSAVWGAYEPSWVRHPWGSLVVPGGAAAADAPFTRYRALSGAAWVTRGGERSWELTIVKNPRAERPLPI